MKNLLTLALIIVALSTNAESKLFFHAEGLDKQELIFATMEILSGPNKKGSVIKSGESISLENGTYTVLVSHLKDQDHWKTNAYGTFTYEWEQKKYTLNIQKDYYLDVQILKIYHFKAGAVDNYYNKLDNVIIKCNARTLYGESYYFTDTMKGEEMTTIPLLEGYSGNISCYKDNLSGSYTTWEVNDDEPMLIYVIISPPTGIDFFDNSIKNAYPNPAIDYITIPYSVEEETQLSIFNINGVFIENYTIDQHSTEITLNLDSFDSGTFIYRFNNVCKRFIVIK